MHTVLEAIATANPPYKLAQSEAADFMLKTESLSTSIRNRIPSIYANSGIDYCYSCIPDYGGDRRLFNSKNELEPCYQS